MCVSACVCMCVCVCVCACVSVRVCLCVSLAGYFFLSLKILQLAAATFLRSICKNASFN